MTNARKLFIDQYGNRFYAKSVKDLRSQIGGGGSRVSPMYVDRDNGDVIQTGYVIGQHWLTAFVPFERIVSRGKRDAK
jgi:hypothetical protein